MIRDVIDGVVVIVVAVAVVVAVVVFVVVVLVCSRCTGLSTGQRFLSVKWMRRFYTVSARCAAYLRLSRSEVEVMKIS